MVNGLWGGSGHGDESFVAAADLSTHQFKAAEYTAVDTVNLANAVTDQLAGVLMNKPKAGEPARVRGDGVAPLLCDGSGTAIVAGDMIAINTSGIGVKNATVGRPSIGKALDACAAANLLVRIDLSYKGIPFATPA